jgi:hypothetical protein
VWSRALIAASLGAVVIAMRSMGRLWICGCQKVYFFANDAWGPNNSQHLFDPYSFSHIEHGIFFFALIFIVAKKLSWEWRLALVVALESLWEILENSPLIIDRYRTATAAVGYSGDTVVNALGDILAAVIGFAVVQRFGWKWAVVTVLLIEIIMLLTIRDNLLLNIIQLLIPLPSLEAWQSLHS